MLSASDLVLVRGNTCIAADVGFDLPAGRALFVSGDNGCGKSTLLRVLCGLQPPYAGTVRWRGQPMPAAAHALRHSLLHVGHDDALHLDLTARENLQLLAQLGGEPHTPQAVLHALDLAGLVQQADLPARSLSRGQRRRVALARLALSRKPLWLLDEPLAALDAPAAGVIQGWLHAHLLRGGAAVVTCHSDPWLPTESTQLLRLKRPAPAIAT